MNDLERELDYLIGWHLIKRKYYIGLVLTLIGSLVLIIKLILLREFFPSDISYHQHIITYNGPLIRWYIGTIMGSIGISLLLIGLPILINYTKKKKDLQKIIHFK
ncbi:MAG: hypothetical protein ACFFDB_04465 [Promethearchaeota archaeon]